MLPVLIGDVAQRSGVKASALRFYESLNLIESVRSASGQCVQAGLRYLTSRP